LAQAGGVGGFLLAVDEPQVELPLLLLEAGVEAIVGERLLLGLRGKLARAGAARKLRELCGRVIPRNIDRYDTPPPVRPES
jgi:hypothetical protein